LTVRPLSGRPPPFPSPEWPPLERLTDAAAGAGWPDIQSLRSVAMVGVLGLGALLGSLWLEHRTELTLPPPTGPFAVGRAIYDWTGDATLDTLAPVPGTKRELLVWIWYPAAPGPSGAVVDDYLPAQLRAPARRAGG